MSSSLARAAQPFVRFLRVEAAGGILLVAATVVALVWANTPWQTSYDSFWSNSIQLEIGSYRFDQDLTPVVNDVLMAVFFFVVGMEIKRELIVGELRDRRSVALPAMAALGGMIVPALIFIAFNAGGDGARGWGSRWRGVAAVAGIGFTVSLFITDLAFDSRAVQDDAKIGILAASIVAATTGATVLVVTARRTRRDPTAAAIGSRGRVASGVSADLAGNRLAPGDTRGSEAEGEGDRREQERRLGL